MTPEIGAEWGKVEKGRETVGKTGRERDSSGFVAVLITFLARRGGSCFDSDLKEKESPSGKLGLWIDRSIKYHLTPMPKP